jgi:curli biogenesis system outer membrane secretion channel CsgG
VLTAAAIPLLAVIALLAPSASAATSAATLSAPHASAKSIPEAPFPGCGNQVSVTRLKKGGSQIRVVANGFSGAYQHKLWVTDTAHSEVYGPYYFRTSTVQDIVTDTTSPVTWAVEVTYENNDVECASDYYA